MGRQTKSLIFCLTKAKATCKREKSKERKRRKKRKRKEKKEKNKGMFFFVGNQVSFGCLGLLV